MTTYPKCRCHGTFALRELVEECCRPLAARLAARAIRTVIDVPAEHRVVGDRELLVRAVRNLILGAIDAMPDGGTLEATSAAVGDAMELEIADTGESLSDEDLHPRLRSDRRVSSRHVGLGVGRRPANCRDARRQRYRGQLP